MARLVSTEKMGVATVVELTVEGGVYASQNGLLNHNCDRCKELHLMPDGVTPRLWLLSEVNRGYAKKGDAVPSMSGQHPHCRCGIVTVTEGYGFKNGSITYISPGHDEMKRQRSLDKSEALNKAEVASRDVIAHFRDKLGFTAKAQGGNHELYFHPEAPHIKLIVQRGGHGVTMDNGMLKRVGVQTGTKFKQGKGFVPDPASVHAAEYRRRGLLV